MVRKITGWLNFSWQENTISQKISFLSILVKIKESDVKNIIEMKGAAESDMKNILEMKGAVLLIRKAITQEGK